MGGMFNGATSATPNTTYWNTSLVTNMQSVFNSAILANPDVHLWNTSSVTNMYGMFYLASNANPDTSSWNFANVTNMDGMLSGTSFTTANYDILLNRIAATSIQTGVLLNVGSTPFSSAGLSSWNFLVTTNGWAITDGGGPP